MGALHQVGECEIVRWFDKMYVRRPPSEPLRIALRIRRERDRVHDIDVRPDTRDLAQCAPEVRKSVDLLAMRHQQQGAVGTKEGEPRLQCGLDRLVIANALDRSAERVYRGVAGDL